MKMFCQIIDGELRQLAAGFEKAPFNNAAEVPEEIAPDVANYHYKNGAWTKKEALQIVIEDKEKPDAEKVFILEALIDIEERLSALEAIVVA